MKSYNKWGDNKGCLKREQLLCEIVWYLREKKRTRMFEGKGPGIWFSPSPFSSSLSSPGYCPPLQNITRGLFGNWTFDPTDDFTLPDGSQSAAGDASNMEIVHNNFGMLCECDFFPWAWRVYLHVYITVNCVYFWGGDKDAAIVIFSDNILPLSSYPFHLSHNFITFHLS